MIACPNGAELVKGLISIGINAAVIGKAHGNGVRLSTGETILPPEADELYKLY